MGSRHDVEVVGKSAKRVGVYQAAGDDWNFAPGLKALAEQAAREYEGRFLLELIQNGYDAQSKQAKRNAVPGAALAPPGDGLKGDKRPLPFNKVIG